MRNYRINFNKLIKILNDPNCANVDLNDGILPSNDMEEENE